MCLVNVATLPRYQPPAVWGGARLGWCFTVHSHAGYSRSSPQRRCLSFAPEREPVLHSQCPNNEFSAGLSCSWLFHTTTSGRASPGPWWRSAPTEPTARRRGRWSSRHRGRGGAAPARTAASPAECASVQCQSQSRCGF